MELVRLNPWWKDRENILRDKNLLELEEKPLKWVPDIKLKLVPGNIFSLRGPRQIGKTTLVKLWIKDLLLVNRVDKEGVFFWNCDELVDFRELSALLREYLKFAESHSIKSGYIFLDEVSRVKDWQRAIKSMVDSGELKQFCLLLTGSHVLDIKYGIERLPGRTGKEGKDLLLLPLTFREYVKLVAPEIANKIACVKTLSVKALNAAVNKTVIFDSELKMLFGQYLITGGFPLVINEFYQNKKIPDYIYQLYFKWIVGDLAKWGRQERILIQLMKAVISKQTSAISWDSLAKEAEIKSHKTISSYIEVLENMFVLLTLYFFDLDRKMPDFNKNKKVYFIDPFIYHVFNNLINMKENEVMPALIEATVISNFCRRTYTDFIHSAYYWKNKKEIDCLLKFERGVLPFEIKYQNKIAKSDYKGLYYFPRGFLITKDYLHIKEKYSAYPAHIVLAVI